MRELAFLNSSLVKYPVYIFLTFQWNLQLPHHPFHLHLKCNRQQELQNQSILVWIWSLFLFQQGCLYPHRWPVPRWPRWNEDNMRCKSPNWFCKHSVKVKNIFHKEREWIHRYLALHTPHYTRVHSCNLFFGIASSGKREKIHKWKHNI